MKKIPILSILFLGFFFAKSQYSALDVRLYRLEERFGINKKYTDDELNGKKFVMIKKFDDHTERLFITFEGKQATYIEIFDDNATGKSAVNIFSGDVMRAQDNVFSFRFDALEGKKISIPITKTMLLTAQKNIVYFIDANNKDRWIEESAFGSKNKELKHNILK